MNTTPELKSDTQGAGRRGKPGPKPRLPKQEPFNTNLPTDYRQRLEAYSDRHGISMAETLRRAIDALTKTSTE